MKIDALRFNNVSINWLSHSICLNLTDTLNNKKHQQLKLVYFYVNALHKYVDPVYLN